MSSSGSRSTRKARSRRQDYIVGLLVFLLVMELSRLAHPDAVLDQCRSSSPTRCGAISARSISSGIPARRFHRVVTSSTVEFSTGIYGIYGQLALTLIAAFLLLAGVANGFDAQRAMIQVVRRLAGRSRQLIPQTAVMGSMRDRHGQRQSGSANAAVVGTITIPLMIRYGVPGTFAAAVETGGFDGRPDHAADDGRRRLPDVGVPRRALLGCGDARFCAGVRLLRLDRRSPSICCACACCRSDPGRAPQVPLYEKVKTAIFFSVRRLSDLPDGLGRQGRAAGGAVHRELHVRAAGRRFPRLQVRAEGPRARGRDAVGQHSARHRDARRDDVLPDAAAGHARHHDRPVHRHRLHQPHGRR